MTDLASNDWFVPPPLPMKHRWGPRCARPVFSSERLDVVGEKLRYCLSKPTPDGQTIMLFKPSELLDKLAQLIPPPRRHRHHYHGVLAPHSPLRTKVLGRESHAHQKSKMIEKEEDLPFLLPETKQEQATPPVAPTTQSESEPEIQAPPPKKESSKASLYRWATIPLRSAIQGTSFPSRTSSEMGTMGPLARIFEVSPLECPKCKASMKIISFIQDRRTICKILNHINKPCDPPAILPARTASWTRIWNRSNLRIHKWIVFSTRPWENFASCGFSL